MKTFKVTDPRSGRTLSLTSQDDMPPSEQELEQVFSSVGKPQQNQMFENVMNVIPGIRGAQEYGKAYEAVKRPVVDFQESISPLRLLPDSVYNASATVPNRLSLINPLGALLPREKVSIGSANRELQGLGFDMAAGEVIGRAPELVGNKILKPAASAMENTAGRMMNFYIKPRQAAYSFGSNPGRSVAKYVGPTMTREGILEKVASQKSALLERLAEAAKNSTQPVDATPIFEEIASTVEKLKKLPKTYAGQIESHMSLAEDMASILREKGQVINGKIYVNAEDAVQVKRALGEIPSWSANDPKLGSLSKTTRKAYGRLDREIDKAIPGAANINRDVSDLIGAEKGITLGMQREQNKAPIGLLDLMAGAVVGGATKDIGTTTAAIAASKAMRGAPFNTTMASGAAKTAGGVRGAGQFLESTRIPTPGEAILGLFKREPLPMGPKALPPTPPDLMGPETPLGLGSKPFRLRRLPEPQSTGPAIRLPDETQPRTVMQMPNYVESELMAKYGDTARIGQPRPSGPNPGVQKSSALRNPIIDAMKEALARRVKNFGR